MIYTKIIIGIGVAIGLLLYKKTNPIILKVILIGLALSYGSSFFMQFSIGTTAYLSFGLIALVFAILSGVNKKWMSLIIGLFAFMSFLFYFNHYPYVNIMRLLMLIPIASYSLILRKWNQHINRLSVLTILAAYELTELILLIEQWIN